MTQMSTYKQRTLETNKALQANIAAGGERERQARHALHLADIYYYWHQVGSDDACERELARYQRYTERIGYDPMEEIPSN
jgi:hypothetical protein